MDCLFCSIASGDIPADIVMSTDRAVAFRDIAPQAPVHVLVIPRAHAADVPAVAVSDPMLAAELLQLAYQVAEAEGVAESGYRLVANTGSQAGQTVPHAHVHVLGGRGLGWPPG